jgi:Tfp pilus assembly protein PilN
VRELEFLPEWYPTLQRRKQTLTVQGWIALAVVLCMAAGALAQRWQVHRQELIVRQNSALVAQSGRQLAKLDDLQNQMQQLQRRQQVVGEEIDTTKLMAAIGATVPSDVSLLELGMEEHDGITDRRVNVHLQGVAPTDADVASLLVKLNAIRFFDQVEMSDVRDRVQNGHVQREFEVSFTVQAEAVKGKR